MRLIDADELLNLIRYEYSDSLLGEIITDEMTTLIDAQPTVPQWIPCSEKMPPCGETVLVTVKADDRTWTYCDTWFQGDWMAYMGRGREVTAWMPLPEPYKEDRQ